MWDNEDLKIKICWSRNMLDNGETSIRDTIEYIGR